MSIIKIDADSIERIRENLDSFAGNTYMAQKCISEVIPVLDEMQFSTKEEIKLQLENYKNRLGVQHSLGNQYKKAVNDTYDALCDVDDSLSDSVEGVWSKVEDWKSYSSNTLAPFASCALVQNQAAVAGTLVATGTALGFVSIAKKISETIKNWFSRLFGNKESLNENNGEASVNSEASTVPEIDHTIPIVSAWVGYDDETGKYKGDIDYSIWPDGYREDLAQNWAGCAVASTSSALSGLLGRSVTPKEIMSYQDGRVNMEWGNGADAWGVNYSVKNNLTTIDLDNALDNYLDNPDRYSAPIIGAANINGNSHYVVVVGFGPDKSTYKIIDSSGNYAKLYTVSNISSLGGNGFSGPLNQLVQYEISK